MKFFLFHLGFSKYEYVVDLSSIYHEFSARVEDSVSLGVM